MEFVNVDSVTFNIAFNLGLPEFMVVDWNSSISTIFVSVPKAPVNENGDLILGKNNIRFPG